MDRKWVIYLQELEAPPLFKEKPQMKSDFQAKFLQHLLDKQQDEGFTLIELLVVIIIIGILSAIALPSFLNQANKAKQSEAKTYVGSLNRAQQAAIMERGSFTSDVGALGLGIRTQTENYGYGISTDPPGASGSVNRGGSLKIPLRSYVGITWLGQTGAAAGATSEVTSLAIMCESKDVGQLTLAQASDKNVVDVFPNATARGNTSENYVCQDPSGADKVYPNGTGPSANGWATIK